MKALVVAAGVRGHRPAGRRAGLAAGPDRHRGGAGGDGGRARRRGGPRAVRGRQGARLREAPRRRQALGLRGGRRRRARLAPSSAAPPTWPPARRWPWLLPGAVMPGRHGDQGGQAARGAVLGHDPAPRPSWGWHAKSAASWSCPTTGRRATLLADYLPISEAVLEVEVTPNRPDCLSIRGLAREIAAITGGDFEEDLAIDVPCGEHRASTKTSPSRSGTPTSARDMQRA